MLRTDSDAGIGAEQDMLDQGCRATGGSGTH